MSEMITTALFQSGLGSAVAIASMMLVTYLCRVSGVALMSRVKVTARVERALRALPGAIVLATITPLTASAGLPAWMALAAALSVVMLRGHELLALAAGLGAATLARAFGL
jgi:uncharacterized membrane protein